MEVVNGDNWSYKTCKAPVKIVITNKPTASFLQAGCPFCRPTNSVRALLSESQVWSLCVRNDASTWRRIHLRVPNKQRLVTAVFSIVPLVVRRHCHVTAWALRDLLLSLLNTSERVQCVALQLLWESSASATSCSLITAVEEALNIVIVMRLSVILLLDVSLSVAIDEDNLLAELRSNCIKFRGWIHKAIVGAIVDADDCLRDTVTI